MKRLTTRPKVQGIFKRGERHQHYRLVLKCWSCGNSFVSARPQTLTCSEACRKQKSRVQAKAAAEADRLIRSAAKAKKKGRKNLASLTKKPKR